MYMYIYIYNTRMYIHAYIHKPWPRGKATEWRNFLRVFFHSKGVEMVNLSSINSKQARLAIPDFFHNKDLPIISYMHAKLIGPTIFNFRKVAQEHDINEPLNN